ncbi:MAG TPA: methyltransferase domain-containing protein [Microthrixaceae bacterium]|nr:methyltransferase domain-containing protein [Microthrixaceae bacterium]
MAADHWFEDLADHMGPAYLRYSFTKGTGQEVAFLVEELGLEPGMRVLDVGCGPGRHVNALAALGIETVGLDISQRFVDVGASAGVDGATFVRGDARAMAFDEEFDAAISLCQGAFGLGGPPQSLDPFNLDNDAAVLAGIWRALRPGGRVALTAFSAYFQVRWLEDHDRFDAATAVNHEPTEVRDEAGKAVPADLWTTCYTPRELRLLVERTGLDVADVWSVSPGAYARNPPDLEHHEFLVICRRSLADGPPGP